MKRSVPAVLAHCARTIAAGLILAVASVTAPEAGSAFLPARSPTLPPSGARALCNLYDWACRPPSGRRLTEAQVRAAFAVNGRVNGGVREVADAAQYGRAEVWALPTRRGGDCEDIALMKKRDLIAVGLPPERLLVATVLHPRRGAHAVLVLRTDAGDLVLDNLRDRVLDWRQTGYRFLRMQDPQHPRRWITVLAGTS